MKTNVVLLALAVAFGILGVAGAQTYPPPSGCDPYYCNTEETCVSTSGTCGQFNNPYNRKSVQAGYVGFCIYMNANGCTYSSLAFCSRVSYYNIPPGGDCGSDNDTLQCSFPTYQSGCNP